LLRLRLLLLRRRVVVVVVDVVVELRRSVAMVGVARAYIEGLGPLDAGDGLPLQIRLSLLVCGLGILEDAEQLLALFGVVVSASATPDC
jgi:hypothetical protein